MEIRKGTKSGYLSFQDDFPKVAECTCGGVGRLAFTAKEEDEEFYICDMWPNEGKGGYWPHDAIAVAVYFCRECMKPVVLYNQA